MRFLLSGDIHLNPGPFSHIRELDMLIDIVTKDCKNLNICLFNARSLIKTNMTFSLIFLTNLTQNTIVILTENWLNETDIYPENLFESEAQISKSISSKTGVMKGGGVAIWVPRDISSKQRNDLNVLNKSFFESL